MTITLILFFISLISIGILITKRVALIRSGEIAIENESPLVPRAVEVKHIVTETFKKYSFVVIEIVLRTSMKSSSYIKKQSLYVVEKIQNKFTNNSSENPEVKKEISGFLKTVSEYKRKIKALKKKIREEEKD